MRFMNYYPFDSRNSLYRSKIGALAEGETLRLKLLLHKDASVHKAFLVLRDDKDNSIKEIPLSEAGWVENYKTYECELALGEGLYWYTFRYTSDYGEFVVTKTEGSLGIVGETGRAWQQTVFSADFKTPDWLKGGIIYQIFPDRFYNSGSKKKNVPEDRYICEDWLAQPEFKQTGEKKRLGNDYFGGDLKGIEEKLPYIKSLGVNCIYLNPIFEAHSNHRYNTADYMKVDLLLGDETDLVSLIKKAKEYGIGIILDGVFSHTGDDSIYFNKKGRYASVGAYQSKKSSFYSWYKFTDYPEKYESWWGVKTLPEIDEDNAAFTEFITGENGVLRYWLKKGIMGWRLDVADELPDKFLDKVRAALKAEGEEKFLLGEVWEDATNKISYGIRRRFLRGKQLDSVMNYPFANAIVAFVKEQNAKLLLDTVLSVAENYPACALHLLMNHIGTHDTARILTRLGSNNTFEGDRYAQSMAVLSDEEYELAIKRLKIAAVVQYTLPGVPSLYYGDEAGLTGYGDPFCRAAYPWNDENTDLLEFYKNLGTMRNSSKSFSGGEFVPIKCEGSVFAFFRKYEDETLAIMVNSSQNSAVVCGKEILSGANLIFGKAEINEEVKLDGFGYAVFKL